LMTPKSLVYMVVAVFVGYMLVSAVPGQVAMYTVPSPSLEKSVELYWDTVNLTDGREYSADNESIWFEIVRTNGSNGFWVNNESISSEIDDLSEFGEESDAISDVAAVADLAVEAAESAAEAVSATASTASEAAVDAAEAANAAKSASSGLEFMGTMVWLTVDIFIALVVYWLAKRRFA